MFQIIEIKFGITTQCSNLIMTAITSTKNTKAKRIPMVVRICTSKIQWHQKIVIKMNNTQCTMLSTIPMKIKKNVYLMAQGNPVNYNNVFYECSLL